MTMLGLQLSRCVSCFWSSYLEVSIIMFIFMHTQNMSSHLTKLDLKINQGQIRVHGWTCLYVLHMFLLFVSVLKAGISAVNNSCEFMLIISVSSFC